MLKCLSNCSAVMALLVQSIMGFCPSCLLLPCPGCQIVRVGMHGALHYACLHLHLSCISNEAHPKFGSAKWLSRCTIQHFPECNDRQTEHAGFSNVHAMIQKQLHALITISQVLVAWSGKLCLCPACCPRGTNGAGNPAYRLLAVRYLRFGRPASSVIEFAWPGLRLSLAGLLPGSVSGTGPG